MKRRKPRQRKPHLKRMEDMNEPELSAHFSNIIEAVDAVQPDDVIGSMVITFTEGGITQYVASINPQAAPDLLRELADRIEKRNTVER